MYCSLVVTCLLQNGEPLIKYGERGDKLYLIRYGKVRILRPDDSAPGGRVEVAKLGRGNLVGERTVVTGVCHSCCIRLYRHELRLLRKAVTSLCRLC